MKREENLSVQDTPVHDALWHIERGFGQWRIFHRATLSEKWQQCAALYSRSGYFRMAPNTDWGTSLVLPPIFWRDGALKQGAPVKAEFSPRSDNRLQIALITSRLGLKCRLQVLAEPPRDGQMSISVRGEVLSAPKIDIRDGESFKIAMLSSMHVSPQFWDAQSVRIGREKRKIDVQNGWIFSPRTARSFACIGGATQWKPHAPSMTIHCQQNYQMAAWRTPSDNRNDDNLAVWAARDEIVERWFYTATAQRV